MTSIPPSKARKPKETRIKETIDPNDDISIFRAYLELFLHDDYCHGLVRTAAGEKLFDECVSTRGLIASLVGDTQEPIMTCSCTVPECAGFDNPESLLGERFFHWTIRYHGQDLDLLFERDAYEDTALAFLRHLRSLPWPEAADWGTWAHEYGDAADFASAIDGMLSASPRLAAKWQALAP